MTPWLFGLAVEGFNDALAYQHDKGAWFMWHAEAFARQKRLPPLKNYLSSAIFKEKTPETKIDSNAIMKQLRAYKREYDKVQAKGKGKK